jgi:hypothetical protein
MAELGESREEGDIKGDASIFPEKTGKKVSIS